MPIRITGMYSGLDTEAIISELVSAQSVKKSKYVKDQTKLSWKMDAWKALNTKIYNFYTNTLDNMRFQASYMKKTTKVSDPNALSVTPGSNAANGVQNVMVRQLAQGGRLTGRDLSEDLENVKSSTKLSELGISGDASFDVTVGGKKTSIKINGDMKISDLVKKLQDAGLNASFDDENHRFFISSKDTGAAADFSITANNEAGLNALEAIGLLSKEDLQSDEYKKWASYKSDTDAYQKVIDEEVAKRAAALKAANESLEEQNESLKEELDKLKEDSNYKAVKDAEPDKSAASLYDELYGQEQEKDGVMQREGGLQADLDAAKSKLEEAQKALQEANAEGSDKSEEEKAELQRQVEDAQSGVDEAQAKFNEKNSQYKAVKAAEDKQAQIDANQATIDKNRKYYTVSSGVDENGESTETVTGTTDLENQVKGEFDTKVELADKIVNSHDYDDRKSAIRIKGQDAIIEVDGATFTSSDNNFNINGLSIDVYATTDKAVTLTTGDDVEGVYDMVKNFFTEYNKLIIEMDTLYNADSAKGYDPLTSEEKAEMADSEIEEWEKKIKDSLLRRDGTLGDVTEAMKNALLQGATVNGKTMYLSDFGINTLGYWNAGDNEKGAYHIDGDPDDANTKKEADTLHKMLSEDPDTVMNFFSGLANNLYNTLSDKMKAVKDTSSAFTVYNDKTMQKEYDNYKEKIAKEEDKLNALMDKWYSKFSQMETAMAKLQSKSGALGNMLGGS